MQEDGAGFRNLEGSGIEKNRMGLLDQFAAAALSGMLEQEDAHAEPWRMDHVCVMAYAWAEAMLAAKAGRPK